MSGFFSRGGVKPLGADAQLAQNMERLEIDMMTDMYTKLSESCRTKCVSTSYKEPELNKGECVCIDRCVAKYLDLHDKVGKKLSERTMQDQASNAAGFQPAIPAAEPAS